MCSGENVYGIVAGLITAVAVLVMAYAERHPGDARPAHPAHAVIVIQKPSPVALEIGAQGLRLDINF